MPRRSDRERNRRDQVRGRKPSKKKKTPAVEIPREEVNKAVTAFKHGKTVLFPTDTVYAVGCDATNYEAVEKVFTLTNKNPQEDQLVVLVNSFQMLERYIEEVPEMAWQVLKHNKKPLTIIYDRPKGVAENTIAPDNTLAIRVTNDPICRAIIRSLRKPVIATIAHKKGTDVPAGFYDITDSIRENVEFTLDLPLLKSNVPLSSIIKLSNNGTMKIVRK